MLHSTIFAILMSLFIIFFSIVCHTHDHRSFSCCKLEKDKRANDKQSSESRLGAFGMAKVLFVIKGLQFCINNCLMSEVESFLLNTKWKSGKCSEKCWRIVFARFLTIGGKYYDMFNINCFLKDENIENLEYLISKFVLKISIST